MREFTVFKDNQGQGYICNNEKEIFENLQLKNITLANEELKIGKLTTLNGFFCRKLYYMGYYIKDDVPEMIFEIGKDKDKYYYQSIYKISETRILSSYTHNRLRDWNFKNSQWK